MNRRLGVNIDHVATLRQARRAPYPDPVLAAMLAEQAGAQQITAHLRADRRHIQDADLRRLREAVTTQLNVECAATPEMIGIMLDCRPHRVTLVPERPEEITTEGGLDLRGVDLRPAVDRLSEAGIRVSLFIDPDPEVVALARMPGVDQVELNTARYAEGRPGELQRLVAAMDLGSRLGLAVAAGHGLTIHNLPGLVQAAPGIEEYNIGHSIVSRAVFVGFDRAVRDLLDILKMVSPPR